MLTVAILSSLDFHVILLSVALLGVIVAVIILLFPTSRLSIFSFICIPVTTTVDGTVVVVCVLEDWDFDVLLLLDDEELPRIEVGDNATLIVVDTPYVTDTRYKHKYNRQNRSAKSSRL